MGVGRGSLRIGANLPPPESRNRSEPLPRRCERPSLRPCPPGEFQVPGHATAREAVTKEAPPKNEAEKQARRQQFQSRTAGPAKESAAPAPPPHAVGAANAKSTTAGGGGGAKERPTPEGTVSSEPLAPEIAAKLKESYGADLSDVIVRSGAGAGADAECAMRGCAAFALGDVITMSSKAGEAGEAGSPGSAGYNEGPVQELPAQVHELFFLGCKLTDADSPQRPQNNSIELFSGGP